MPVVKRMRMVAVMLCGIIFSISTPAVSAGHEKSADDAPPSPAEMKAIDQGLRERIDILPQDLKEKAHRVQDLYMQFMQEMAVDAPNTEETGHMFFDAAITFMGGLAEDPRIDKNSLYYDPAVHELIHFIANDFGEGDVPKDVPTRDLIRGEIAHLKDGLRGFTQNPPTHPWAVPIAVVVSIGASIYFSRTRKRMNRG